MATIEDPIAIIDGSCDDLDSVMVVMNAAFGRRYGEAWTRSQLAGILPMNGVSLVLARDRPSDDAIGFSLVRSVADESELLLIAVLPSHHRRGVGRRLLEDFMERCRNEGIKKVHLEVRDGNPAVEMYRTAGFSAVGRRKDYYRSADGCCFDAITLASQL
jgi:ribosomal-protein-alanine N-acetyltransferase